MLSHAQPKPCFLPETAKVLNTKREPRGAARPREHKPQPTAPPSSLYRGAPYNMSRPAPERKGKNSGEVSRKEEGEWKGRRDGAARMFQPADFNPSGPR